MSMLDPPFLYSSAPQVGPPTDINGFHAKIWIYVKHVNREVICLAGPFIGAVGEICSGVDHLARHAMLVFSEDPTPLMPQSNPINK